MDDSKIINLFKGLVIDGVNKAKSGHPGGAMSSMDFAYILFKEFLTFDPDRPDWAGRDRFILSAGHESMLQYAFLFANGWLNKEDLMQFRQVGSRTPGHPENHVTPGVECTTGPLGQGCGMSVGFAAAARHMSATLDKSLYGYNTWVLLGDGCMQEGITLASASLAGHLGLDNLIWYYDKNKAQISGNISRCTSDDEAEVFRGLGWHVVSIDGHNHNELRSAMKEALSIAGKPCLIVGNTIMAKGASTMEGKHQTHGAPLPGPERDATKVALGIPGGEEFYWPENASQSYQSHFPRLREHVKKWESLLASKKAGSEKFADLYRSYFESDTPEFPEINWDKSTPVATRNAFGKIVEAWADTMPQLIGGSADLEPSNMTGAFARKVGDFQADTPAGRNLNFGVREFPMSAMANGMALHGGLLPFDATFLSFADYSRPALRLGAIQKCRVIHEFTHDSFYLGEDGPTHQPVEHLMSLRSIPDLYVMRPADPVETEIMMRKAATLEAPSCVCLTRQKVSYIDSDDGQISDAAKGAWVVRNGSDSPELIIFATGSEVSLALAAAEKLEAEKKFTAIRVVSVPCWELFFQQDKSYQESVLSDSCKLRVSVEAGTTLGWEKFVGREGLCIGLDQFGASGPAGDLEKLYGFTPDQVCGKILQEFKR